MERLRQKQINEFILSLNNREQDYLKRRIIEEIDKRNSNVVLFTCNLFPKKMIRG